MFRNSAAIKQFLYVSIGETICVALMLGVYALIGKFSTSVLVGAIFGEVATLLYFLSITVVVSMAADKAENTGQAAKAKLTVQSSSTIRLLALAVIYIIVLKAKICDPIAAVLPLIFLRISITLMEFFRRDGEDKK
jgi:hypothetical protein